MIVCDGFNGLFSIETIVHVFPTPLELRISENNAEIVKNILKLKANKNGNQEIICLLKDFLFSTKFSIFHLYRH